MQSTNLLNKTNHIDISIYYDTIDERIFNDTKFKEMVTLIENQPSKYIYALYGDNNLLKNNIYIPIFHTSYLVSKKHNVIINDIVDLWLLDIFPNNNYYAMFDSNDSRVKFIHNLTEIG